jgi:hypothetical protein
LAKYSFNVMSFCTAFLCLAVSGAQVSAKCEGLNSDSKCITQDFMNVLCNSPVYMEVSGLSISTDGAENCQITLSDPGALQCNPFARDQDYGAGAAMNLVIQACRTESDKICEKLRTWISVPVGTRTALQTVEKNMVDAGCGQ